MNTVTYQCQLPGVCSSGHEWDWISSTCVRSDEPTKTCVAPQIEQTLTVAGVTRSVCIDPFTPPDECNSIAGYATDTQGVEHQICNDDKDACTASGGTFGYVNDKKTCLPADYADSLPVCDHTQIITLINDGYVCSSPPKADDPENPDVPNSTDKPELDKDGDGVPDSKDGDIDGDGIPNSTDPDSDGDGVANVDDKAPLGDEEKSSVSGGGSCDQRPVCKGDAVNCAILFQQWTMRCDQKKSATLSNSNQCNTTPTCKGPEDSCAVLISNWREGCLFKSGTTDADSLVQGINVHNLDGGDSNVGQLIDGTFNQAATTSSCPVDRNITLSRTTLHLSYAPVCSFASSIRPVIVAVASFISFRTVMGAF